MDDYSSSIVIPQPCEQAVEWMIGRLNQAGLSVRRTFDLHQAMGVHPGCDCPHHGTEQCDCQMVVLVVSGSAGYRLAWLLIPMKTRPGFQWWITHNSAPIRSLEGSSGIVIQPPRMNPVNKRGNSTAR